MLSKAPTLTAITKYITSFLILVCFYFFGNILVALLPFSFPAPVAGMILLFLCLTIGIIKTEWLDDLANFVLKHMLFFFIPSATGLVEYTDMFFTSLGEIAITIIFGIVANIVVIGFICQGAKKC